MDKMARYEGRDIAQQEREWRVQRVGWVVMALLVLAGLAGLLGDVGPLANAQVSSPDEALRVTYVRFEHHHAPAQITVRVAPESVVDGQVRVWVDAAYAQAIGLESVLPEPESMQVEPDRVVYVFNAGDQPGPLEILFSYNHEGYWRQEGTVGLVDGPSVRFTQFVFP